MTIYTLKGHIFETTQESDCRWVVDLVLNPQASPSDWKRMRVLGRFGTEQEVIVRAKVELISLGQRPELLGGAK